MDLGTPSTHCFSHSNHALIGKPKYESNELFE